MANTAVAIGAAVVVMTAIIVLVLYFGLRTSPAKADDGVSISLYKDKDPCKKINK